VSGEGGGTSGREFEHMDGRNRPELFVVDGVRLTNDELPDGDARKRNLPGYNFVVIDRPTGEVTARKVGS